MASIVPHNGKWRAFIDFKGVRKTKVFSTKSMAQSWARQSENEIEQISIGRLPNKTFGDLLDRYQDEVTPKKRSADNELKKITAFRQIKVAGKLIVDIKLDELNESHFAQWRDIRLKTVSAATVRREWNILSNACTVAVKEWKWLKYNPLSMIKKPPAPKPRDRIITDKEIEQLLYVGGYDGTAPVTATARVCVIFLFAIETGMRLKEMTRLTWDRVHDKYVQVTDDSKTGRRDVPLSKRAIELIEQMKSVSVNESVFQLNETQVDSLFRKLRSRALLTGFTFHDAKHLACTRLSKKLTPFELARMVGTRDLKTLLIYFNRSASDIADSL